VAVGPHAMGVLWHSAGLFGAATTMISFGAVIGRTTPSQLVLMTFFEVRRCACRVPRGVVLITLWLPALPARCPRCRSCSTPSTSTSDIECSRCRTLVAPWSSTVRGLCAAEGRASSS
jgi:hypothetical protein